MALKEKAPLLKHLDESDDEHEKDSSANNITEQRCSTIKKIAFAIGGPPNQLTHTLIGFHLNAFLLTYVQLQPSTVGIIVLLGRAWDALMDPTVGVMTTKTRSVFGSLRPWLIGSTLPLAFSFLAIWVTPSWYTESEKAFYVTAAYLLYQLSISMYYVPYTALTMHLSHHPADIQSGTGLRIIAETLSVFGGALLTSFLPQLGEQFYNDCQINGSNPFCVYQPGQLAYMAVGLMVSVFCVFCGCVVTWFITEQKRSKTSSDASGEPQEKKEKIWVGFKKTFQSKTYRVLTLMFIWVWMSVAMVQANFIIYSEIPGGLEVSFDDAVDFLLGLLGVTVFSTPIWIFIMSKLGKKRTYQVAVFFLGIMSMVMYFLNKNNTYNEIMATFAIYGFPLSAVYLVPAAMLPDIINEAAVKENGIRREALFYSFFVFLQKFGAGITIYTTNAIIENVGKYDSKLKPKEQPDTVAGPMRALIGIVAPLMIFISFIASFWYPLTTEDEIRIKHDLERIRQAKIAEVSKTTNTAAAVHTEIVG